MCHIAGSFGEEEVAMPTQRGKGINCFGLFTRGNESWIATSDKAIKADFVVEQLERFSFSIKNLTVVVLDNARIHTGKEIRERLRFFATERFVHLSIYRLIRRI